MKIALVVSVGTTSEPIFKAIEDALKAGEVTVFLVYGRQIGTQSLSSFDTASRAAQFARELGATLRIYEAAAPESLDDCLKVFEQVFDEVERVAPEKTIVDFTGGTKVMSTALVHVALSRVPANLELQYIGGPRNEHGRVAVMERKRFSTAAEITVQKALHFAEQFSYAQARALCEGLPNSLRAMVLKNSIEALWHWDNFHYKEAFDCIKHLKGEVEMLADDPKYGRLARTIKKMRNNIERFQRTLKEIHALENKQSNTSAEHVAGVLGNDLLYLVADFLENAARRLKEKRYADAVLRSYRAVEAAVQCSLISRGINPWSPEWQKISSSQQRYLDLTRNNTLPDKLTLYSGMTLLEILASDLDSEDKESLKSLATARNHCHLEHGFSPIAEESTAKGLFASAEKLCRSILSRGNFSQGALERYRDMVSHEL